MRLIDLTGQRFGCLTVVERGETRKRVTYWVCHCDCGQVIERCAGNLRKRGLAKCGTACAFTTGRRPWPKDPRYMVGEDGSIAGPSGQILRQTLNSQGYPVIGTRRGGWGQVHPVHIIVCETFHGPRPDGMEAAHENGVKTDCRASNLSWKTPAGNSADRIRHGTQSRGVLHGRARLNDDAVRVIRQSDEPSRLLAARFGVHRSAIEKARSGQTWAHVS